jgi:hypothetical protein
MFLLFRFNGDGWWNTESTHVRISLDIDHKSTYAPIYVFNSTIRSTNTITVRDFEVKSVKPYVDGICTYLPTYLPTQPPTHPPECDSVVGWGTMLKLDCRRFDSRMRWIIFNLPNPSSRTMALGSTQPLTEMSTRSFPGGKKRSALRADNLAAIYEPNVWKCGSLKLSHP